MSKTAGCWEASTPSAARPGSGRDEARAALREPARRTRCGKMLSGREREEGHAFSLPPAPRQGPQAAASGASGAGERPRGRCARAAGCGCRAPRARRVPQARSSSARVVGLTEMRTRNATFPSRQARDNQDRLQIIFDHQGQCQQAVGWLTDRQKSTIGRDGGAVPAAVARREQGQHQ
jgi:hypothetical protein